jgi:isopentenyl-diphosphate Delta-isomerase
MEEVILVDESDQEIGAAEKMQTHREGRLHRAFSIFVFDSAGRMLLQKRAGSKYHSASLWSNTCCGHPRPGEAVEVAALRRLREEMDFTCSIKKVFEFIYKVRLTDDMFEHEYDHVFVGTYNGLPAPSAAEVEDWRWIEVDQLVRDLRENPDRYTYWFRVIIDKLLAAYRHLTAVQREMLGEA